MTELNEYNTCGTCYCEVRDEHYSKHSEWHNRLRAVVAGLLELELGA